MAMAAKYGATIDEQAGVFYVDAPEGFIWQMVGASVIACEWGDAGQTMAQACEHALHGMSEGIEPNDREEDVS